MALSNIAIKLSQLKKKVFIIDFDLEAPGLQFKFESEYLLQQNIKKQGLVDYIYTFANENLLPETLADYVDHLEAKNIHDTSINFLSAGNFESDEYWRRLATTKWSQLFYSENAYGIRFFLDLKAKIINEYNPDFLLIDSRTGITEISGITLKIFADEVVVLAVNNKENLFGSKKIITSLTNPEKQLLNRTPKIHVVLTRLPFPKDPIAVANEYKIVKTWEKKIDAISKKHKFDISIIHTDKQIHTNEIVKIGVTDNKHTITHDYSLLFEKVIDLSDEQDPKFIAIKSAENYFNIALRENDSWVKLEYFNFAIELDKTRHEYFLNRGVLFYKNRKFEEAFKDFEAALNLKPSDGLTLFYLSLYYYEKREYDQALEYLKQISTPFEMLYVQQALILTKTGNYSIALKKLNEGVVYFPNSWRLYNDRANLYRREKNYKKALKDIEIALELDPENATLFATMAEIQLSMNNKDNFYLFFNIALSMGLKGQQLNATKGVYEEVKYDKKFQYLLDKYQINLEDMFK